MRNLKNSAINGDAQELQNPQWLLRCKLTLFGFLVVVCDKVDDWDKFSKKNLGLGRLHFHAISHLKVSPALARDHKLFLLAWYIYRGCLINFKLLQFCSYYYSFFFDDFINVFHLICFCMFRYFSEHTYLRLIRQRYQNLKTQHFL